MIGQLRFGRLFLAVVLLVDGCALSSLCACACGNDSMDHDVDVRLLC